MSKPSETRDPIGRCYVLSEDLTERDDLDGGEWKFCEGRPQGHEQFGFCQQGLSVSFTPDNNFILFGAPGTYNWKGMLSAVGGSIKENIYIYRKGFVYQWPFCLKFSHTHFRALGGSDKLTRKVFFIKIQSTGTHKILASSSCW